MTSPSKLVDESNIVDEQKRKASSDIDEEMKSAFHLSNQFMDLPEAAKKNMSKVFDQLTQEHAAKLSNLLEKEKRLQVKHAEMEERLLKASQDEENKQSEEMIQAIEGVHRVTVSSGAMMQSIRPPSLYSQLVAQIEGRFGLRVLKLTVKGTNESIQTQDQLLFAYQDTQDVLRVNAEFMKKRSAENSEDWMDEGEGYARGSFTEIEIAQFKAGLKNLGHGQWSEIANHYVKSRSRFQIREYARSLGNKRNKISPQSYEEAIRCVKLGLEGITRHDEQVCE